MLDMLFMPYAAKNSFLLYSVLIYMIEG